jgi:predicted nucleic acid-binding protein
VDGLRRIGNEHERKGVYYRPQLNWTDTFKYAVDLSKNHTGTTGSRTLDILHVASALSIKAERFLTFDDRQSELASLIGLKIEDCTK